MDIRSKLLWVDSMGGLFVGVFVIFLSGWLSVLHGLPQSVLLYMGVANVLYGSYSFSLVIRKERPEKLILLLVVANMTWTVVCVILASMYSKTVTLFGLAHLLGEGVYVGTLGFFEWRWRAYLLRRS